MYEPCFRLTPYLLNLIGEAGALRSSIDNASLSVAWLPILNKEARAKAAHSSTSIEGNPLTLSQARAIESGEKIGTSSPYEKEIKNYLQALRWAEKHAPSAIDEKRILTLHQILMRGLLPEERCGRYKEKQNYIVNGKGIRIYTPPSPKETPKLIRELIAWLNSKESKDLHSVAVCAVLHHRLASIHPFPDGNGRLARLLGTWVLYQRGFDTKHIFSLDDFFAEKRERYYQKIQQARELDDDLTFWIEYVAEGIVKTLKDVKKRIEALQVSSAARITLSPRQEELIRILRDESPIGVAELREKLKLTRARINQLLSPLIKSGIVAREGESRATRYRLALK